jgi:hypothetical protein
MLSPRQIFEDNIRPADLLLKAATNNRQKGSPSFSMGRMTNE